MTLRLVLVIAGLTLREIVRRRIVWVLLLLAVISIVLVGFGVERLVTLARGDGVKELEIRIGVSQVLILIAFMFSFVLAMSAAFLAAPAIASDVETGTVHAMLARPMRRSDLVVGRWLGLAIVVAAYAVLSGLLAIAVVGQVSGHVPPAPFVAVAYLAFQAVTVLTLALTLGTRLPAIAAGAVTVVLFGLGWFVGVLGNIAIAFDAAPLAGGADLFRMLLPTDGLWRGVIYGLEPPLVLLSAPGATPRRCRPTRSSPTRRRRCRLSRGALPGWSWCWPPACCCSAAASCRHAARPSGQRRGVEQVAAQRPCARRPGRVVHRAEHVRGHRPRPGRTVQGDLVEPAGHAAVGQVERAMSPTLVRESVAIIDDSWESEIAFVVQA